MSKEEELRLAKEKKAQMDAIKKQYSQVSKPSGNRNRSRSKNGRAGDGASSSDMISKCTREDDINVEQFMKEDLYSINK